MPTVAALFSAGKDSALAAVVLDPFYDVVLCSCTFGLDRGPSVAETTRETGERLGLPVATVELEESVAREAVDRMVTDDYPREGIQLVHEHALETVAAREAVGGESFSAVADGTRRDDRAPVIERPFAQSLEDRNGIDYLRPLAGYGRGAIDELAGRLLDVETGPSEAIPTGDYETELRALMADEYGEATVSDVFPEHVQSRVRGRSR
ncbi:alpha hydrolase [Halosimplex litoreum]|uniref:Alpha hydrolase n=1 Tax=Halosimplex litoreum TaxID=1198301 RepID=A0A7T3G1B0_9EURY|nr:alpha hydrolase [Halosimplex litoreum]QPV64540.1 alpha hydrolase [Halosimplex litoreum]